LQSLSSQEVKVLKGSEFARGKALAAVSTAPRHTASVPMLFYHGATTPAKSALHGGGGKTKTERHGSKKDGYQQRSKSASFPQGTSWHDVQLDN
ncbi:hypothetical protein FK513_31310, partial [Klebsiella pneumoniae]|uniref:hypothetical protein n=1 Tax=Klebsiella pneumoniae TaxID=573 RepID=UPI00210DF97D